ncbi:hypothetical protein Trydic_g4687 [Trypoxylus dichotomus]
MLTIRTVLRRGLDNVINSGEKRKWRQLSKCDTTPHTSTKNEDESILLRKVLIISEDNMKFFHAQLGVV